MATNPNDVARALNEMVKTLQELSDRELESVESIFLEKKKSLEQAKKIEESKKELTRLQKHEELKQKQVQKEEIKTLKFKKTLLGFVDKTTSKLKANLFEFSTKDNTKDIFKSFVQQEKVKVLSFTRMFIKKQSSEDFSRTSTNDVSEEQLTTLKEIDYKIGKLTGQSSGGFFDSLFSSLKDVIGNIAGDAGSIAKILGIAGLGTAGAKLFGGKGGTIRNVISAGLKASRNGSISKGGKIGLVAGGVTALASGLYAGFSGKGDEDSLQTRKVGGKVSGNDVYLVGENGPELFTPKQNGFIIPNNKLKQNNGYQEYGPSEFELFSKGFKKNIKTLLSNLEDSFFDFDKVVIEKIKNVYENVKKWIIGKINGVVDTVSNGVQEFKKNIATKVDDIFGTTFSKPVVENKPEQTIVDNRVINNPEPKIPTISPPTLNTNFDMTFPKQEPIIVQNNFKLERSESLVQDSFDKNFWTNDFVSKFKEGLKKKENNQRVKYNVISSPTL